MLNEVPREVVDHEIAIYFSEELKGFIPLQDAPSLRRLRKHAESSFWQRQLIGYQIWPSLRYLSSWGISLVLEGKRGEKNPEEKLDKICARILLTSVYGHHEHSEKKVLFDLFRQVVGSIGILFDPLFIVALDALLGVPAPQSNQTTISQLLNHPRSILEVATESANPIRLLLS